MRPLAEKHLTDTRHGLSTLSVTEARTAAPIGHTSQRFLSTPPRSRNPGWLTQVLRHVHDLVTQRKERRAHERLGEQVRDIVRSGHEGDANAVTFNELPHEEVPTVDMLHAAVVLRVVGYIDGRAVVNVEIDGFTRRVKTELGTQVREVYGLLGRLRSGHDLGLARGQGHTLLLLGSPRDSSLIKHEDPTRRRVFDCPIGVGVAGDGGGGRCRESVAPAPEGGGSGVWSLRGVRVDLCRTVRVDQVLLVGEAGRRRNGEQQRGRRSRSGGGKARRGRQDSGVRAAHRDLFLVVFNVRHLNNCQVCYGLLESAHAAGCG